MMGKIRIVFTALFLCCAVPFISLGQCASDASSGCTSDIPHLIRFSGQVKAAIASQTGIVSLRFTIYDSEKGGTALWQEVQNTQSDMLGRYEWLLGAPPTRGFPPPVFPTERNAGWACKFCDPVLRKSPASHWSAFLMP